MLFRNAKVGQLVCVYQYGTLRVGQIEKVLQTRVYAFGKPWSIYDGTRLKMQPTFQHIANQQPKLKPYSDDPAKALMIKNAIDYCLSVAKVLRYAKGDEALQLEQKLRGLNLV